MSALAVYIERAGIATVVIGLVRLHLEKIQPPRALWVPFEMGRPLGAYNHQGAFQKKVLRATLQLLDRTDGPVVLEDFPEEDPGCADDTNWIAPVLTPAESIVEEVRLLRPRWEQACGLLGRTMTGLSGLPIEVAADYLERFDTDTPAPNPGTDMSDLLRMRFSADDLRTYYAEAALANGDPSSRQIGDWFWESSLVAQTLLRIRASNLNHSDSVRAAVCGGLLVPGSRLPAA